ncbi:hypothetical protein [Ruminococcus bicirculans (ex Wegman et al. 2014)]|nr:hypothetical protein [Ruminococcus bicirculans (ex Wegman et al. 2014)]
MQIPRTCKKLIEIFNSHTGHHFLRQPFKLSVKIVTLGKSLFVFGFGTD